MAVGILMSISVLGWQNRRAPNRGAPMKRGGGRGPDPDLAEKRRFLNFFDHFGPLAQLMESRVEFYHTNFSRRSHPRRPEFLPLGKCRKAHLLTSTLDAPWADFGPTLGRLWADFGLTLGRLWAD